MSIAGWIIDIKNFSPESLRIDIVDIDMQRGSCFTANISQYLFIERRGTKENEFQAV